jgi:hypothetical protein
MALEPLTQGLDDSVDRLDKETNDTKQDPGMKLDIEKGAAQQDHTANGMERLRLMTGTDMTTLKTPKTGPLLGRHTRPLLLGFLLSGKFCDL